MILEKIDKSLISGIREVMELADHKRLEEIDYDDSFIVKQTDIAYINDDKQGHLLDIYSMKDQHKNTPVIINVHGGGLIYGYKELNYNFNCELVRRGFKVVSLNYELLPNTTLLNQLKDIAAAMRFIQVNRNRYNLNVKKLYMVGDSAGALLCYMFAGINYNEDLKKVFGIYPERISLKGLCLISTMLDTHRKAFLRAINHFVVGENEKEHSAYPYLANPQDMPIRLPKTLLITSSEDILREETHRLYSLLRDRNIFCKLHDEEKGDIHPLPHIYPVAYPLYEESAKTIDLLVRFFNHNLSPNGPPSGYR